MFSSGKTEQNRVLVAEVHILNRVLVAEVHILGTETWRVLPFLPNSTYMLLPTYLNSFVYWLCGYRPMYVISFDIERECFESISIPPSDRDFGVSIRVLGGDLFISAFRSGDIHFWAMKDNGVNMSWSQISCFGVGDDENCRYGPYKPMKYLNNGALLMCRCLGGALIYKDRRKKGYRYLKVRGYKCGFEAITHIPSFVPLKYALSGHDVKVLNVNSRLQIREQITDSLAHLVTTWIQDFGFSTFDLINEPTEITMG